MLLTLQEHDSALDRLLHRHHTLPERERCATPRPPVAALDVRLGSGRAERDGSRAKSSSSTTRRGRSRRRRRTSSRRCTRVRSAHRRSCSRCRPTSSSCASTRATLENRSSSSWRCASRSTPPSPTSSSRRVAVTVEIDRVRGRARRRRVRDPRRDAGRAEGARRDRRGFDAALVAEYERAARSAKGAGVARLVGTTCQGCHLSIPADRGRADQALGRSADRALRQLRRHPGRP